MTSLPGWGSPPGVEKHGPVMACGCFISTVSNPRLRPSPAAKGEARRGKRHMPMKGSGGTGPRSLMRPPPCRASEATAAQGHTAGCGKRPGAGYDEPPRMGLPAGCGKTWPCHGMWLFHLHSIESPLAAFPGGERRGTAWEKAYAHEGERRHGATLPHASASMPGVRSNSRTGAHCRVREKAGRRL